MNRMTPEQQFDESIRVASRALDEELARAQSTYDATEAAARRQYRTAVRQARDAFFAARERTSP